MKYIVLAALASCISAPVLAQTPPVPPAKCDSPGHSQFDFWVGDWDVYPASAPNQIVAHSKIEKLYAGCAVRENWMPLKGGGGGSLNNFDPESGLWHQLWIGSSPGRAEFSGGLTGSSIVLTGMWANANGPGQNALTRMSYTPNADGSVRQHGEQSTDHGLTWTTSFDFIYRKSAPI